MWRRRIAISRRARPPDRPCSSFRLSPRLEQGRDDADHHGFGGAAIEAEIASEQSPDRDIGRDDQPKEARLLGEACLGSESACEDFFNPHAMRLPRRLELLCLRGVASAIAGSLVEDICVLLVFAVPRPYGRLNVLWKAARPTRRSATGFEQAGYQRGLAPVDPQNSLDRRSGLLRDGFERKMLRMSRVKCRRRCANARFCRLNLGGTAFHGIAARRPIHVKKLIPIFDWNQEN